MLHTPPPSERRRRRRYVTRLIARVRIHGIADPMTAELADLSAVGCFLRGADVSFMAAPGDAVAFGCVMGDGQPVALARGKVVRRSPGDGLGILIEHANEALDRLLGTLAGNAEPAGAR